MHRGWRVVCSAKMGGISALMNFCIDSNAAFQDELSIADDWSRCPWRSSHPAADCPSAGLHLWRCLLFSVQTCHFFLLSHGPPCYRPHLPSAECRPGLQICSPACLQLHARHPNERGVPLEFLIICSSPCNLPSLSGSLKFAPENCNIVVCLY